MLSYDNRPTMPSSSGATSDRLPLSTSSSAKMLNGNSNNVEQPKTDHHHIWLITGPAGCGKSTVAQFIAKSMNLPYMEGDEVFHLLKCLNASILTDRVVPPQSQR